jgi:hypothetical protein
MAGHLVVYNLLSIIFLFSAGLRKAVTGAVGYSTLLIFSTGSNYLLIASLRAYVIAKKSMT